MATKTGESGEEPATILNNNTGIATTAGPLAESSTSSSSSSTTVPTVILTESTATSAGNLPLTGSQQQSLHQVQQQQQQPAQQQQQQQTRQKINLITDVAADDVAGKSMILTYVFKAFVATNVPLAKPPPFSVPSISLNFTLTSSLSFSFFPSVY